MRVGLGVYLTALRATAAAPTGPWNPAQLGASLALWLDADDSSTITLNGSNVAQWSDKSGNDRHATQATAANQPAYLATGFNGKPTLTWDGNDDAMLMSMSLPVTDLNLFAVADPNGVAQNSYIMDIANVRRIFATNGQMFSSSWLPAVAPITTGGQRIYGFTTGPANQIVYSDGTAVSTIAAVPAAVVDGVVGLGNRNSGTAFGLNGEMSEVVFVSGTLSDTDRQRLEGYLAWKWGLAETLPNDHPYRVDGRLFGYGSYKALSPLDSDLLVTSDGDVFIVQ